MKTLTHEVQIQAPVQTVWNTMFAPATYIEWAKAFSPNSQYRGEWIQGTQIDFIDPNMGGTRAIIEKFDAYDEVLVKHIAILDTENNEDTSSEHALKWIGTIDRYFFRETEGITTLKAITEIDEIFEPMFVVSWPQALQSLKTFCENL